MPDPLDLRIDIGPDNEYFESIREATHRELAENIFRLALNPQFLGSLPQDPLEILMQCEELDEATGYHPGSHLDLYYESLRTHTFKTGLIIHIKRKS